MNSMEALDYMEPLERPRGANVADYVPGSPAEAVDLMIRIRGHLLRLAEQSKELGNHSEWYAEDREAFLIGNRLYLTLKAVRDKRGSRRSDFSGRRVGSQGRKAYGRASRPLRSRPLQVVTAESNYA